MALRTFGLNSLNLRVVGRDSNLSVLCLVFVMLLCAGCGHKGPLVEPQYSNTTEQPVTLLPENKK